MQNPILDDNNKENELVNNMSEFSTEHLNTKNKNLLAAQQQSQPGLLGEIISVKFQILEQIGSGGFGSVYKAKHLALNKTVALKLLRADYVEDQEIAARFQHEAEIASHLAHTNIVSAFDYGMCTKTNVVFIAMEYVSGLSLKNLIKPLDRSVITPQNNLTLERIINIVSQLCDGISYAHTKGILHRDIKPSNILITSDENKTDHVKITDFGIAKVLNESEELKRLTKTANAQGQIMGTTQYMSPEQCQSMKLTFQSDVYSIGCVLFELLTGHVPFDGSTDYVTANMHITAKVPDLVLDSGEPVIKNRLANIVSKALMKNPSLRYQSVDDLRADLKQVEDRLDQLRSAKTNNLRLLIEELWLRSIKQARNTIAHLHVQRLTYSKLTIFSLATFVLLIILLSMSSFLGTFGSHYDMQYQPVLHKTSAELPSKQKIMFLLTPKAQLATYIDDGVPRTQEEATSM